MLKKFAEKEQLRDHLLYIIKQDEKNRIDEEVIEPVSNIIMEVMDIYEEIVEEEGQDVASGYLFNVFASYVMLGLQTLNLNEELLHVNDELVDINKKLLERINE